MKLLHCISTVNPAGGGPIEGVKQLYIALRGMGHCTEVLSLDPPNAPWVAECPMRVHTAGPSRGRYAFSTSFVGKLHSLRSNYSAIIVNGIWQYNSLGTWLALHRTGFPYFVFTHGMLDPWFKRTYPLKHLKKWMYWPWAEYRVLRDAKAVLFTCEQERRLARQSFWLYHCNERVVNYGTAAPTGDPEQQKAAFLERFPALRGKRLLLFLSRIHPKKGCDLLIKAFAKVVRGEGRAERGEGGRPRTEGRGQRTVTSPGSELRSPNSELRNLHLVIAGPDQVGWVAELKALAAQMGVADRITWPGMLSGDVKWGAIRCADAFVLPSHQENFGIAVAEAMACGVPVLISNQVNIWREIEEDRAGIVDEDTEAGTENLLHGWLGMPDAARRSMCLQAVTCFATRFEIRRTAESLLGAIQVT